MTKLPSFTSVDTAKLVKRGATLMRKTLESTFDAVTKQVTFAATPAYVATGLPDANFQAIVGDAAVDALNVIPVEWSVQLDGVFVPFLAKVYDRGAQQVVAGVKDAVPQLEDATLPTLSDDATTEYLKKSVNRIRFLSDEMWEMAREELLSGMALGESTQELAARVKGVTGLAEKQALTVARTEVMAALNGGQFAQMRKIAEWGQLTVTKQWEATDDHIVRPSHAKADGQVRQLDGIFTVGSYGLAYPGDPAGVGESINCRCTVLYDVDSTSLETLSAAAVPVDNGQNWSHEVFQHNLKYVTAIIAAGKKWDASEHPRGNDGKFIRKGFLPGDILEVLKDDFEDWNTDEGFEDFIQDVAALTSEHWSKLKPEQKQKIATIADNALNQGVPGSASALLHLEDLDNDELVIIDEDDTDDPFVPTSDIPTPQKAASPFKLNPNKGKSGDGYAAPGLWGKYGAAGLLIQSTDPSTGETLYLMVQRGPGVSSNKGKWQLPGGAIDENETFEEGAARELFEEVGASEEFLASMSKVGSHNIDVPIPGKKPWTYSNIAAKAPAPFTPKVDGTETGDAGWFSKSDILLMKDTGVMHPALAKEIDKIFGVFDGENTSKNVDVADITPSNPPAPPAPDATPPSQLSPPKPIKITHALIHKKHSADTIIAVTQEQGFNIRVRWDGALYKIERRPVGNMDPSWEMLDVVKKSKLYDVLALQYTGAKWMEPGKLASDLPPAVIPGKPVGISYIPGEQVAKFTPGKGTHDSPMNLAGWKKIGGQAGSNEGGTYVAPDGTKYYVKKAKSPKHAKNEVLANQLYAAAGIDVPDVRHGVNAPGINGPVIVSKVVPNAETKLSSELGNAISMMHIQEGFAVDAWLANWDVVGLGYDNIVSSDGKWWRIDAGGSLMYRAMGGEKGSAFGNTVGELKTLKDGTNTQASAVFGTMNPVQEIQSAKKLLPLTDDKIDQFVKDAGLPLELADKLKARRNYILDHYGLTDKSSAKAAKQATQVTQVTSTQSSPASIGEYKVPYLDLASATLKADTGDVIAIAQGETTFGSNKLDFQVVVTPTQNWQLQVKDPYQTGNTWLDVQDTHLDEYAELYKIGKWNILSQKSYSNEDVISNWSFVDSDTKYASGDVVAKTSDGKFQITKLVDADGQNSYDIEQLNVDNQWQSVSQGIPSDLLPQEINDYWSNKTWIVAPTNAQKSVQTTASSDVVDLNFSTQSITPDQIIGISEHVNEHDAIATGMDNLGKTWKVTKTDTPGELAIFSGSGGGWQYEASPSFDIFKKDSSNISWVPTGHALFAKKNLAAVQNKKTPTVKKEATWTITESSIWGTFKSQPVGTVFIQGTSRGGTEYRIISAESDYTGQVVLQAQQKLDSGNWDVLSDEIGSSTILGAWIHSQSMNNKWQIPGQTAPTPVNATNVNAPNPSGNPLPNTPTNAHAVAPTNDISHISVGVKYLFYNHFKKLNISPSWSPKAIYEKLIQAQQTSVSPEIQALNVPQLLAVVDSALPWGQKSKSPNNTPFTDKVMAWSGTPAGAKVLSSEHLKDLKAFGKQVTPSASSTGNVPGPASTLPKVNQVNSPVTAKSPTSPIPIPGAEPLAKSVLHGISDPVTKIGNATTRKAVYAKFKEDPNGKYLKHDVESIWKNLVKVQKQYPQFHMLEIVRIIDQGRADHTNSSNNQEFEKKIKAWLGTKDGYMAATHEMPFDADSILKHNAPSASTLVPLASQPDRTKADVLAMNSSAFQVLTTAQATSWYQKQSITTKQKSAQKKYTGSYYYTLNKVLRLQTKGSASHLDDAKNMQEGMRPIDQDILVHRGTGFDQFGGAKSHEDLEKLVGKTVQDKAFMSTSVGGKAAFGGSVLMEIEVPKGTGVMFVKPFSHYASENEMLLSAGLRFRVISVTKKGYQTVVRVRVVPPPDGSV